MMGATFPVTISFALNSARKLQDGIGDTGSFRISVSSIVSPIAGLGNILVPTGITIMISSLLAAVAAFTAAHYRKNQP
jgi:hypothetical protein